MREQVRRAFEKVRLEGVVREFLKAYRHFEWQARFGRQQRRLIDAYLGSRETRKLHIGCGHNLTEGWLNTDLFPRRLDIVHLDATEPFPFGAEEFDYVFSEHMIEHIPYPQGLHMLSECYRVLRKNGTVRISTPDLAFLIDLYKEDKSDLQKKYVMTASGEFGPYCDEVFVINNFVRAWGHQFIYDERTLGKAMEKAGFQNVVRCELNRSERQALCDLEHENRMPEGFLRLETLTLEGTKLG